VNLDTYSKIDNVMSNEQFSQVVEAILAGKYSWACLLILRFAGYNPLHYMPYRTYNRLMKDNIQSKPSYQKDVKRVLNQQPSEDSLLEDRSSRIRDLNYLEPLQDQSAKVHGGSQNSWETLPANVSRFRFPALLK
jgi:hypothetical protein